MSTKIKWTNIEPNIDPTLKEPKYLSTKLSVLRTCAYDAVVLHRVEQWLKNEVESNQDVADAKDNNEEEITSDGTDDIIYGRVECANSLSEQISTWKKELRGLK